MISINVLTRWHRYVSLCSTSNDPNQLMDVSLSGVHLNTILIKNNSSGISHRLNWSFSQNFPELNST